MRRHLLIAGVALLVVGIPRACCGQPFSNVLDGFGLFKTGHFDQTGPAMVVVDHYTFTATALEESGSTETINGVELSWTDGSSGTQNAVLTRSGIEWSYYDDDPTTYASEADLTNVHPSANDYEYTIEVDGAGMFTESLDGPNDLYPDTVPAVSNFAALQSAHAAGDIDIEFAGFSAGAAANFMFVRVVVADGVGFVWGDQDTNTATSLTIPAGTLQVGTPYTLSLRYEARRLDSAIGTVFTGAFANYTFEYVTEMDLVVIPEPQTSNLLLLALAGLYGLTLSDDRRRTRA